MIVFLKIFLRKLVLKKKSADDNISLKNYIVTLNGAIISVCATDRHCRKVRRNNKFGAKNMNLATTIGERRIAGKNFCLASERLLRQKFIASCRIMVINVYLNCQLTPQLSTTQFGN